MQFDISQRSRERLGTRIVVASTSGGKDSTALALTLMEHEIPHVRVFADTGFEAPETYEYLDLLRSRLGPIEVVRNESLWQDALPGEGRREAPALHPPRPATPHKEHRHVDA